MPSIDVLLPTYNRLESLVATLSGIASQTLTDLRVIVADQSDEPVGEHPVVVALRGVITARGGSVEWHARPQVHGVAEQRDFLLRQATADYALFIDDDVFMEPQVIERLHDILRSEGCAFAGAFGSGPSHLDDVRAEQQVVECWDGPVQQEVIEPGSREWERWNLHRAANVYHAGLRVPPGKIWRYKVAWIGACVLYDRRKLLEVGGFAFWERLPRYHSGEEVLVQNLLMRRWGGCGILPSGTWFMQVPTTVLNDAGAVDGHALDLLEEMVERYAPSG